MRSLQDFPSPVLRTSSPAKRPRLNAPAFVKTSGISLKFLLEGSRRILPLARINRQQMAFEQNLVDLMRLALF